MKAPKNGFLDYLKDGLKSLKQSFSHRRLLYVALIEAALLALAILSFLAIAPVLITIYSEIASVNSRVMGSADPALAMEVYDSARRSVISFFAITLSWMIGLLLLYSTARASQWLLIAGARPRVSQFLRFFGYTVLFIIGAVLWSVLTYMVMRPEFYSYFVVFVNIPLLFYLNMVIQPLIGDGLGLWKAIWQGIRFSVTRIHLMLIPLFLIFVIFTLVSLVFLIIAEISQRIAVVLYLALTVFFLAWLKTYAFRLVKAYRN